jgi:hypothetical protein
MSAVLLVLAALVGCAEGITEYRRQRAPPRTLPPGARPVKVRVALQPIKVLEIDADSATVRMQAYFDQFWNDVRLARLPNSTDEELDAFDRTINGTDGVRRFYLSEALPWTPDTTFSSASERQDLQTVGDIDPYYSMTFTRVFENGDVHRSQRIEITLPVEFAIEYFPFEVIPVIITIESYGFTNDAVAYELINFDAAANASESLVELNETKLLPGYGIGEFSKSTPLFTDYIEGTYTGVRFEFLIEGSSADVVITAGTTTTVLVLLAGIPLWYDTDFNTKMTIIATMLLTAFALTFSFTRPEARRTLFLELFLLSHQLFIAFVGFVVFVSYVLTKLRKALLVPPTSGDHQRQDVAVERMISHLRRKSSRNTEPVSAPDSKKQLAVLMLIEEALRDEKTSDFAPVKPWKLFTVLAYMFTWLVNLFAFYAAGLAFQRQALKGRFDVDGTLQRESGIIFISVYCVGIPVMLCLSFLASSVWRRKQESILFSLASFVVLRFRGDTDEAEHATQLKNIQRRQSSKALAIPEAKETGKQAAAHDDANMTSARDSATAGTQRLRFSTAVHELNADADDDDDVENSDLPMPPRDE